MLLLKSGEHGEALAALRHACSVKPEHTVAQVHFTLARIATNNREKIEHCTRYTELKPADPYGWLLLGNLQDDSGDSEKALIAYRKGHEANPTEYRTIISCCRVLSKLGREEEATEMAVAGAENGALHDTWQRPSHMVRGLSAHAWRDDVSTWRVARVLESNFAMIRAEVMALLADGALLKSGVEDTEGLTKAGTWTELNILFQGITQGSNSKLCPETTALIERDIPEAASMVRGAAKLSVLVPGTIIRPHHGPTNTRMRCHLGIRIPDGCYIRAGDPAEPSNLRQWEEGKVLCFDDSYRHEVWHEGTEKRVILCVDVWHPDMDHAARLQACENQHQQQVYSARYDIGKKGVGWN